MLLRRFKSSNAWLARQKRDPFVKQRSGEFRSRSAFKLLELDSQYKFLKPGSVVVDLGAAPGGWSEAAIRRVFPALITEGQEQDVVMQSSTDGSNAGRVIAVDIIPMEPIMGVHAIQGDFLSQATRQSVERAVGADRQVDVVISDMCKNISGNRMSDVEASLELCYAAFTFARDFLPPSSSEKPLQGVMVLKHFAHPILDNFRKEVLEKAFKIVRFSKPSSSRNESSEGYWICRGRLSTIQS